MSSRMSAKLDQDEFQSYKAAFHAFDWNNNGKISSASLQVETRLWPKIIIFAYPKAAMRRAGANPTDVEVLDIINRIDNETGYLDFPVSWKMHLECQRWSSFFISGILLCDVRGREGEWPGDWVQGDLQGLQQGPGGMHPGWGDKVSRCYINSWDHT